MSEALSPKQTTAAGRTCWMRSSLLIRMIFWKEAPGPSKKACRGPMLSGVGSP